jgi:hypothetical protein
VTTDRSAEIAASGPLHAPFPPYVQGEDARLRWKVCAATALACSAQYEPDGRPSASFVWTTTRALYNSDEPTGTPDADTVAAVDEYLTSLEHLFA